jgi:hypothetical protein
MVRPTQVWNPWNKEQSLVALGTATGRDAPAFLITVTGCNLLQHLVSTAPEE